MIADRSQTEDQIEPEIGPSVLQCQLSPVKDGFDSVLVKTIFVYSVEGFRYDLLNFGDVLFRHTLQSHGEESVFCLGVVT